MTKRLDDIDRHILRELQQDGRMTNLELARRVGLSSAPCLRRVRILEEAGYIKGYYALLDEKALGLEVTAFAMVRLSSQAESDLHAFEAFVSHEPLVRECWMLLGEADFILRCVAPSLSRFQVLVAHLTGAPKVVNVKTSLTLHDVKRLPAVPYEILGRGADLLLRHHAPVNRNEPAQAGGNAGDEIHRVGLLCGSDGVVAERESGGGERHHGSPEGL